MTNSESTATSAPTLYFTKDGGFFEIFFITFKNNESFIKIVFRHPIRTFEYDNRFIIL